MTKKTSWFFILIYFRESATSAGDEYIVVAIIANAGHFAADTIHRSVYEKALPAFAPELMDRSRMDADALAWLELYPVA